MTEEERKLKKWKEEIEKREVPDDRLENAIQMGYERAKAKQMKTKRLFIRRSAWSMAIAAILMLAFITSIRVSLAFASAVASIPGMSGIVDLIQDNKGLQLAIENDHYQKVGVTGEADGMKVTLEGIITDEASLVAFNTIEFSSKRTNAFLSGYRLLDKEGEEISEAGGFNTNWNLEDDLKATNSVEIEFKGPIPTEEMILEVEISEEVDEDKIGTISLPFTINLQPVKQEKYVLNQTVVVEGQSITIKSITIGPIKTAVEVEFAEDNTMQIFGFEDLRIADGKGDVWSSIKNGVYASGTDDPNVTIYYLQSNFFKETEKLSLKFNKLMALDKEEAELIVDTEKEEIIKQPKDGKFSNLKMHGPYMEIELKGREEYHHNPFSTFYDADGKELHSMSGSFSKNGNEVAIIGLDLPNEKYKNPLRFPLHAYPSYIKGNVEINIK
ncbi:hypothetical protein SLU01_15790 [Sporosarcina luteola]|uniref:DUF4179 domain-containing protein n=1 Tax=Sporosarcina luteola TaxID=582850 RepID=A0A511Z742_9BACL|nr:DUF4179 domain-containing protein [Sporosarcina luteola]GEN83267.1 hypothetical protein SLU01_15790 [Sporosarcina luteola]